MHLSRSEFQRIKKKSEDRAKRSEDNAQFIRRMKKETNQAFKKHLDRKAIKDQIVRLLGLLDMYRFGKACRIFKDRPGEVGYHLVPQQRGDAARFLPENVVWASAAANDGERLNRSLYREKHVAIFGKNRVEAIEAVARRKADFSTATLLELRSLVQDIVKMASRKEPGLLAAIEEYRSVIISNLLPEPK